MISQQKQREKEMEKDSGAGGWGERERETWLIHIQTIITIQVCINSELLSFCTGPILNCFEKVALDYIDVEKICYIR